MPFFGPPNIEKVKARHNVKGLIKALGYEKDQEVMREATKALVEIGSPAVMPLINALKDKRESVRHQAIEAIGEIGDPRAVAPLIDVLEDNWVYSVKALAKISTPQAIEPLLALLSNPATTNVRREWIAEVLSLANAPQIIEPLRKLLETEGYYGDPNETSWGYSESERERVTKNIDKVNFRQKIIEALSNYKYGRAIWGINIAMEDNAAFVRGAAADGLK